MKIRDLLDLLDLFDKPAIDRLCELRAIRGRSRPDRCEGLARSYRGDHAAFVADLRKNDLALLVNGVAGEWGDYLPRADRYSREDLERIALQLFADDEVPDELVSMVDDDEGQAEDEEEDALARRMERSHRDAAYVSEVLASFSEREAHPRRRYQDEALEAIWRKLAPGAPTVLHVATGGGKTLIASDVVERWLSERRGDVLWITKDWNLLYQGARTFSRRHGGLDRIGRIGGDGTVLHPIPERPSAVRFTTLRTLGLRLERRALEGVTLIVWDECHWGEHGSDWHALRRRLTELPIAVLGLTATPRRSSELSIAYSKTFADLIEEGALAAPRFEEPVVTGIAWRAERPVRDGDFSNASLLELGRNGKRNELIVRHYAENASRYEQTIVFACGKSHATTLAEMFRAAGFGAHAIHSDNSEAENRAYLRDFATGRVPILVNVAMLTHGIDVPATRTVILARPTLSDILFSQMIGRAARLDAKSGKREFFVVELTDNVERFAEDLVRTRKTFFEGSGLRGAGYRGVAAPAGRPPQPLGLVGGVHRYDPNGTPTWIPDDESVPEPMRGLWFLKGQTFGLEIELTAPVGEPGELQGTREWLESADALRTALAGALGEGVVAREVLPEYQGIDGAKSHGVWNVEYDASAGWEVTSRVLAGEEGYAEIVKAAAAIEQAAVERGLYVSARTGLHVHLAWRPRDDRELRALFRLVRVFEPALASIIAPSRIAWFDGRDYHLGEPNPYCAPLATVVPGALLGSRFDRERIARRFEDEAARHLTVNPSRLFGPAEAPTIEIRMHSGTTDARKMLLWVSLWQQILWAARQKTEVPDVPDCEALEPDADLIALARRYLPAPGQAAQEAFIRKLAARREEIAGEWRARGLERWAKETEWPKSTSKNR